MLAKDGRALKFNALTWLCYMTEEERSKSGVFLYILVDKSMVYSYNNLAARISASDRKIMILVELSPYAY